MKAWRIKEPSVVNFEEMESQSVGETCVKIKLSYCSISIVDRLLTAGKIKAEYPVIPGRQAVGMVVETGSEVKNCVRGDIVAVKPFTSCGTCAKCGEKFTECENALTFGVDEDGFLRDFAVVSAQDIVKLPERVNPKDAVFIECIDIAIETINRLNLEKGQYLAICGATQLGIILAQAAIYYQIVPILIDIDAEFLHTAEKLGVYYTVNSSQTDTKKQIFTLTGGKMADAAAYMAKGACPFAQTPDLVKKTGRIAVCGLEKAKLDLSAQLAPIFNRRLTVLGIAEGNKNIASAVNMLVGKNINVAPLIGAEIPFDVAGEELTKEINFDRVYFQTIVKM